MAKAKGNGVGDALLARKLLTASQLRAAEGRAREGGGTLEEAIVELGLATPEQVGMAVAEAAGVRFVDLDRTEPDPHAANLIGAELASRLGVLPVAFDGDRLLCVMADPSDREAAEEVSRVTGLEVTPAHAPPQAIRRAIERIYGPPRLPGPEHREPATEETSSRTVGRRLGVGEEAPFDIHELLGIVLDRGGSDLHLTAGTPPVMRLHGELVRLEEYPVLKPEHLQKAIYGILTQKQRDRLETDLELDLSYSLPGRSRFRVNVYFQRGALGAAFRVIPFQIKSVEELGLPPRIADFARLPRGLVVVTGPTGSGKSTTLAAVVDIVNRERPVHIMTVEDPIEFLHSHKRAIVNQREVGEDTHGFAQALRHVLRQDPDVILVGEMRDLETIAMAITAAETGHLVFGTLHTQDAPQTIDRIIDVFPPHQQQQIRVQLAGSLQAVVAQQLLQTADGNGRVVAVEILVATPAVRNLIREAKTHQIYSIMQAGGQFGMQTMDAALAELVQRGRVTYEAALERCHNREEFQRLAASARSAPAGGRARVIG